MKLKISPELTLPSDCVTGTLALLGRKRMGKTYKAKVLAEEMLKAGQQIVVIDPTGAWWGLRSSADGNGEGFPITIFGGKHADVPLESTAGAEIAAAIAEDHFSAIFDLTKFTKGEEQRFCAAFLETLYRKNDKAIHLFLDEADVYAPQQPQGDEMKTLGACQSIVRRGGIKGIGITLITQRPAVLAKSVLTQADTLIALCVSHPTDLGAIEDWVKVHAKREVAKEMIESLPDLPKGDAWVWSPHQKLHKRITFRDLETFDSSRTPKPGETQRRPRVLSKVDLERLGATIAATVEQAKANDPKALRAEVARLKKANDVLVAGAERAIQAQLAKSGGPKPPKAPKVVERAVLKDGQLARIETLIAIGGKLVERWGNVSADAHEALGAVRDKASGLFHKLDETLADLRAVVASTKAPAPAPAPAVPATNGAGKPITTAKSYLDVDAGGPAPAIYTSRRVAQEEGIEIVTPAKQRILNALAMLEQIGLAAPSKSQVAVFAAQSPTSSGYTNNLGALRSSGLISYPVPGSVALTPEGRTIADAARAPQTIGDMHDFVRGLIGEPRWRILMPLIDIYPKSFAKGRLAEIAGVSASSSGYTNNLGSLRSLGLLDYPQPGEVRAEPILFLEAAS